MKIPDKVTIEITAKGFTTKVFAEDTVLAQRSSVMEERGYSKATEPGDFYDDLPEEFEPLAKALEYFGFPMFETADVLMEFSEEL